MLTKKRTAALAGQLRKWRSRARRADETLDLARAYLMDGALMSAAENYRKAATLLEEASAARSAWMDAQT